MTKSSRGFREGGFEYGPATGRLAVATLILAAAGSVALGAADVSSRYDIIMTRQPFWNPPAPPEPVRLVAPARPPVPVKSFTDDIRMCGITETRNGLRVGFIANGGVGRNRTQSSYYLYVGESEDGIEVVSADFAEEKALLRKGSEEGWISMRGQTAAEASVAGVASPAVPQPHGSAVTSVGTASRPATTSYREMLKRRQEERARRLEEQKAKAAESKLTGEELQKHLEAYNLNLIRAGGELGPPLPIPLTPEQDAQLVEEGVLPARE